MKNKFILFCLAVILSAGCGPPDKPSSGSSGPVAIPLSAVDIQDSFWSPRIENNYRVSVFNMLEQYDEKGYSPSPKLIEAASYVLQKNEDPELKALVDRGAEKLTGNMLPGGKPREWKRLLNGELYMAGHFMEAAIEYYIATGNRIMLDAAILIADDIDSHFGPGKRLEISQHEEIKIGLLKLYRYTSDEKYLELARFFLDERGHSHDGRELYGEYAQDHEPVIEQDEVVGHAVRATYLYTSLAGLAAVTGDPEYISTSERLWKDAVYRKTYLTGHIGSYRDHEDFGQAYDLPNLCCWNETCASVGSVFWNQKMFELTGDGRYIDMLEWTLYNGVLPGVSLDGSEYFYQNPLRTFGNFERHPWFGPNCCPPNLARLIASLGRYIYAKNDKEIYVNLFVGSVLRTSVGDVPVSINQQTGYPWDGKVSIAVDPEANTDFTLKIRIPGWLGEKPFAGDLYKYLDNNGSEVGLRLNGKALKPVAENGYASVHRSWKNGDLIELTLPLEVKKVISSRKVADNADMVALVRGPLVYCVEGIDNGGKVMNMYITGESEFESHFDEGLLGGVVRLSGSVRSVSRDEKDNNILNTELRTLTAIPYYAWANRDAGEMSVWIAGEESGTVIPPGPTLASASRVSSSCGSGSLSDNYPGGNVPDIATRFYPGSQSGSAGFKALYDQVMPVNSFDGSSIYFSIRPQEGDRAWVQYSFDEPVEISSASVYWKDDKQYCLAPESWNIVYESEKDWIPVKPHSEYAVEKDKFNEVEFDPVITQAIRLQVKLRGQDFRKGELGPPDGNYMPEDRTWYETGIIEWQLNRDQVQ